VVPAVHAQPAAGGTVVTAVPRMMWFAGVYRPADGLPPAPVELATFSIYHEDAGGAAMWQETQNVAIGSGGRFNVLVGSSTSDGLPVELFTAGEPRWLGVRFHRTGEAEQPRVQLSSVPYALKAIDADTLGGRPASAYALADPAALRPSGEVAAVNAAVGAGGATAAAGSSTSTAGTAGHLGMFTDGTNLGDSVAVQFGPRIGIGTATPADYLHIAFNDQFGAFTGLAVQNLSGNVNAASGMLFYDQNGALAQFQGFSNVTHEYRINNIASGGSINFLLGGSSKFAVATNGNVGIGTSAPASKLQVAGDVTVDGNIG